MTIKKVFDGVMDESIHADFLKFSKGEFKDRYLVQAKKRKDQWIIKTGAEFANYLVKSGLEKAGDKIPVKGVIVSTFDLRDEVSFEIEKTKNFMGIRQIVVNTEIEPNQIIDFMEKHPRVFFALTFSLPDYELKIKAKAPKSAKPSTKKNPEPKIDFCSLKTTDPKIVKELFFDVGEFKEIRVRHIIKIDKTIYPSDFQNMKPEEVREKSKRAGTVIRNIEIDGQTKVSEAKFEA